MVTTATTHGIRFPHTPLATFSKLSVAALLGGALLLVYMQAMIIGQLAPLLVIVIVVTLLGTGGVAAGWRWAPLVGAGIAGLMIAMSAEQLGYSLAHPTRLHDFAFSVMTLAVDGLGVAAGIGATIQIHRRPNSRRAPRWLAAALTALAGLVIGAIAVSAVVKAASPEPGLVAGVSPAALAELPALTTKSFMFDQTEIRVRAGETVALRLHNADSDMHSFDIDEFNVHAPMPVGQSGLALFKPTQPGTYTFYCYLHANKEAGLGMVGTLVVEP